MGNFSLAQGMNKDFICNDEYTEEIFEQVMKLKHSPDWDKIDMFMSISTMVYAGPVFTHHFGSNHVDTDWQINSSIHYLIPNRI